MIWSLLGLPSEKAFSPDFPDEQWKHVRKRSVTIYLGTVWGKAMSTTLMPGASFRVYFSSLLRPPKQTVAHWSVTEIVSRRLKG